MSQRIVLIAGAVIVIALVAFSVFHSTKPAAQPATDTIPPITQTPADTGAQATPPAPAPSAQMPPMESPRAAAPITTPPAITEPEPTKEEVAGVPRTKPEEVLQGLEAHALTIIDVRDADSYKERHIPGALHIPLAYIAGEVPYLPKDKPIVTYCT